MVIKTKEGIIRVIKTKGGSKGRAPPVLHFLMPQSGILNVVPLKTLVSLYIVYYYDVVEKIWRNE